MTKIFQVNPDPDVRADPEIDILKEEENLTNGDIANLYNEDEIGVVAWRRRVNIFKRKR